MSDSASTDVVTTTAPAAVAPRTDSRVEMLIPGTALTFGDTAKLSKTLHASGLLGSKIKSAEQAFAIIVAGAEMGLPPMLALRSLSLVEGKIVLAADSQLALFKRAGGRATFVELTVERAVLWLRHPNGDEHTEEWTRAMAGAAEVLKKDNWKKYPLAMMRSRAITAGLKSIGFEATAGAYDPDEDIHALEDEPPAPAVPQSSARGAMARVKDRFLPSSVPAEEIAVDAIPEDEPEPVPAGEVEASAAAVAAPPERTPEEEQAVLDEWDRLDREEAQRAQDGAGN